MLRPHRAATQCDLCCLHCAPVGCMILASTGCSFLGVGGDARRADSAVRSAPLFGQVEYHVGALPFSPDDLNTADLTTAVPGNRCVFVIMLLCNVFRASSMADNHQRCSFDGRHGTSPSGLQARAEARAQINSYPATIQMVMPKIATANSVSRIVSVVRRVDASALFMRNSRASRNNGKDVLIPNRTPPTM